MQAQNSKCCHIKLWRVMKASSIWQTFNIICILFYCGLYTMAIDVVTWRIIKNGAFDLFSCVIFSACQFFAFFLQKFCRLSYNFSNFIYIYIFKLKLGTEKHSSEVSVSSTIVFTPVNCCKCLRCTVAFKWWHRWCRGTLWVFLEYSRVLHDAHSWFNFVIVLVMTSL